MSTTPATTEYMMAMTSAGDCARYCLYRNDDTGPHHVLTLEIPHGDALRTRPESLMRGVLHSLHLGDWLNPMPTDSLRYMARWVVTHASRT